MIELTTGVVFLMSSLYGAGQTATIQNSVDPTDKTEVAASDDRSLTNSKNIEKYLREQYADTPILIEIARCESEFRQYDKTGNLIRGRVNSNDVGVMQINEKYHSDTAVKLGLNIYTLEGNVAYAKHLYEESGSQPWSASAPCWAGAIARNK